MQVIFIKRRGFDFLIHVKVFKIIIHHGVAGENAAFK
jgi:hypothetical protein